MQDKGQRDKNCKSKTKRKFLRKKSWLGLRDSAHIVELDIVTFFVRFKAGVYQNLEHFQKDGLNYWSEESLKKLPVQLQPKKKTTTIEDKINEIRRRSK